MRLIKRHSGHKYGARLNILEVCKLCQKEISRSNDYEEVLCGSCTIWKMVIFGKCKVVGSKNYCNQDKTELEKREIWKNIINSHATAN